MYILYISDTNFLKVLAKKIHVETNKKGGGNPWKT